MIQLPGSVRVYLCLTPCDMRKSFDGLHALVREHLELDAFAGHLFVFASRRRGSQNGSGANSRDAAEVRELCCR
jgi:transposase